MALSRGSQDALRTFARALAAERRSSLRDRANRVCAVARPPLTLAELSTGLSPEDPRALIRATSRGRGGPPSHELEALIDALLAGQLLLGVAPGDPRAVLIVTAQEVPTLARAFDVFDVSGRPPPARRAPRVDWNADGLWDLFAPPPRRAITIVDREVPAVGFGAMRLSTAALRPGWDEAIDVLVHAFEQGIRLIDTAGAYAFDDHEAGHNERLVRSALDRWGGPEDEVVVVTKVGLSRPDGAWRPNGAPDALIAAARAGVTRLGLQRPPVVLLHVIDPRFGMHAQLEALHSLRERGEVGGVGICNIDAAQLREAAEVGPVAAVSAAASFWDRAALADDGIVAACAANGTPFIAHSPLGGHRRARVQTEPAIVDLAARVGAAPAAVALGWLLARGIGAVPGTTRRSRVDDLVSASGLDGANLRSELDPRRPERRRRVTQMPSATWPAPTAGEAILVVGAPGSGKTTMALELEARGHHRLNRDERGGTLDQLAGAMQTEVDRGVRRFVLDNTWPTAASRRATIATARAAGLAVTAVVVRCSKEDAARNVVTRMLARRGRLLGPAEIAAADDPNLLPPAALAAWFDRFEDPDLSEGFTAIEHVDFHRRPDRGRPALIFDHDGTLRDSRGNAPFPRGPEEVAVRPERARVVRALADAGWFLAGASNQGGIGLGQIRESDAAAAFDETHHQLGVTMHTRWCPHAPRSGCWCRKPAPGLLIALAHEHGLDLARSAMIGDRESDREAAVAAGVAYFDADDYFGGAWLAHASGPAARSPDGEA